MQLISKSIYAPDVQADDRLIDCMQNSRYGWLEIRDILIARYRNRNLRMRVLVVFNQTVKTKKYADDVKVAIKAIDAEVAALSAIAAIEVGTANVGAIIAESLPDTIPTDVCNVVQIGKKTKKRAKPAGSKDKAPDLQAQTA